MRAIIEAGGKQYRVAVGDQIQIEKIDDEAGKTVQFPVLLIEDGANSKIGRPVLTESQVTGEVVSHIRGPKLISYTYRKRKASERKIGHRQPLALIKITDIKG